MSLVLNSQLLTIPTNLNTFPTIPNIFPTSYLFLDEAALHVVAHLLRPHADRRHGAALGQVPARNAIKV